MDISKEYTKMSDCPEIQGGHKYINGDFIQIFYDPCSRDDPAFGGYVEKHVSVFSIHNSYLGDFIWLPRQDQIQEMLPKNNCKCSCCLIFHLNKFVEDNIDGLADAKIDSMEQYWLAYYMSEKHSMIWNGEKWIKP